MFPRPEVTAPTGREDALRAPTGAPPRVLVLGATGYIGGRLVPRLLDAGYAVRVLARAPTRVSAAAWGDRVQTVVGDAADPDALREAVTGVGIVYHLIHSMGAGREFRAQDRTIAHVVARAAADAGVGRIVYLGGLHPDGDLSPHLRSRVEVGEILQRSGIPTLILQAGVVIGSGSASFEMVRHLTEVLPYMPAPRWVRNRIQPIAVRDVLHYLLVAARVPLTASRTVDVGGPDVMRYGQMMNGYALEAGLRQRAIASLPVLTPRLASVWVSLVTPIPRAIARPLVESLQNECVVRAGADDLLPPPVGGLTPYRRAVQLALARETADDIETSWQDAGVLGAPSDPLPGDPEWAGRTVFTDLRTAETPAPPERLWDVIVGIGGLNGWYSSPVLWAVRGWMDKLVGGVGLARGRRSRSELHVGDALDFWRVEHLDPGRHLRLRAEMKVPGRAWLELEAAAADGGGSVYRQRAVFFPRGLAGRLYWIAVLPFHGFIFRGMANRITAAAAKS